MKSFSVFVIIFLFATEIFSQDFGTWKNYTDMKNARQVSVYDNIMWAANEGGVFKYDLTSKEFELFTKSEGLSSQNLTAISIDNTGKVWMGSEEGYINVYNPADKSIAKIIDIYSTDKTLKRINNISISGNNVYVSTDFGMSIINSETLRFEETVLKFGNFISESKVSSITAGSTIYAATSEGIAVLKNGAANLSAPESWDTYSLGTDIPVSEVHEVAEFQGSLVASTDRGVYRLENNTWNSFLFAGLNINDISVNSGFLYVLIPNELYKITGSGDERIYNSVSTLLNSLYVGTDQRFYISSKKGVVVVSGSETEEIVPDGPGSNSFQSLTVDKEGNLWTGSGIDPNGVGIFKFDGQTWTTYNLDSNPELLSNFYHKAYTAPDGKLYFSSWGRGFAQYDNNDFTVYNASNTDLQGISVDPNFLVISGVKEDSGNNLWVLNFWSNNAKPLSVLTSNNQWYHYSFPSPAITNSEEVVLLEIDRNNTKWFSVQPSERGGTLGLYYYNENGTFDNTSDDAFGFFNESSGLNSSNISSIVVDQRGEIWVGTSLGINVIVNPSVPNSGFRNVLPVRFETISTIAVDPINQKWVGTQNGIYVLTSDGVRTVAEYSISNSPLPSNTIRSITFDEKNGIAYIGTDFGLSALRTPSIQPKEQFDEIFVYPNPFIIESGGNNEITIDGLVKNSDIKILSITGKLIREFSSPGGRVAFWDGRDDDGNLVPSGVYIIVAYDSEASNVTKSKVAVIRK